MANRTHVKNQLKRTRFWSLEFEVGQPKANTITKLILMRLLNVAKHLGSLEWKMGSGDLSDMKMLQTMDMDGLRHSGTRVQQGV